MVGQYKRVSDTVKTILSRIGKIATFKTKYIDNSFFEDARAYEPTSRRRVSGISVLAVEQFLMIDVVAEVWIGQLLVKFRGILFSQSGANPG